MSLANTANLQSSHSQVKVALFASVAAFLTYASVYAYRKPFTIALFEGVSFWGIRYQTLLIISQVIGYMLSKFYGIKFIAELKHIARWKVIAVLLLWAWLALLGLALLPPPFGIVCLFLNGLPLGLLWGVVFSYVEGRKATDFIGSVLAVSFILSSGVVKSVGKWLMVDWNVNEQWMPFVTGALFVIPVIVFVRMLEAVPPPTKEDVVLRTERVPMDKADRKFFLKQFGVGIIIITITYFFLTVIRDIRDNFMGNIWIELGYGEQAGIFTKTELPITLLVLLLMSLLVLIKRNLLAFRIIHIVILFGFLIAGTSSWLFLNGFINPVWWMTLVGLGLYMAYIPFNCVFFERMIATFKTAGNVGFLIYIADAFGYMGSVGVMLGKEIFKVQMKWSEIYPAGAVVFSIIGVAGTGFSYYYFQQKYKQRVQHERVDMTISTPVSGRYPG